ncbi:trigger factor [Bacilli bacterium]|nr:trigger factor [Bacilli bacterium]
MAKQIKIPGFRVGKVPVDILKSKISSEEIINNSLNKAINETLKVLVADKSFNNDGVVEDALSVDIAKVDTKNLHIVYIFEKYPDIELPDYKKIKINYEAPKVDPAEVQREIDRYSKNDIMLTPKSNEIISKGDMVNFDFKGFISDKPFPGGEAKDFELEIGSGQFIPGFEDQMIGLKKQEKKAIKVTFPNNYHAKDMAGKEATFDIVINDVKTIVKPTIDEKFVAKFNIPNVTTEIHLREYLTKLILDEKTHHAKQASIKIISTYLIQNTKLSFIPKSLLEAETKRLDNETTKQAEEKQSKHDAYVLENLRFSNLADYNKSLKETATKNLTLVMALEKIIEELKLEVTDKELNTHFEKMSQVYGTKVDDIKARFNNNFDNIKTFILQEKVFDRLIELNNQ